MKVLVLLICCLTLGICQDSSRYSTNNKKTAIDPDIITFLNTDDYHSHHNSHSINYHRDHTNHNHDVTTEEPELTYANTTGYINTYENEIPLDLIHKLNSIQNVSELFSNFIEEDTYPDEPNNGVVVTSRFSGALDVERSAAIMPKPARCIPELTTVPLISEEHPSIFYFPSCTRVMRCGGCCSHSLLACQPTQSETLYFQVIKSQFNGGSQLTYKGKEIVAVEQHNKCQCDCRVKKQDCSTFQEYRKSECRCACTNLDDEKKCAKENDSKLWDPNTCTCVCRESRDCTTGYYYDQYHCKCLQIPIRRRFADHPVGGEPSAENRRRFIIPAAVDRYSASREKRSATK